MFRVVPSWDTHHIKSGPNEAPEPARCNSICARAPVLPATWENAYSHLTWKCNPSPFVSFFTDFQTAVRWKDRYLDEENANRVRIFCFNSENVEALLDAKRLADKLGIIGLAKVGTRHDHEYLVWGWIAGNECAGVYEFKRKLRGGDTKLGSSV